MRGKPTSTRTSSTRHSAIFSRSTSCTIAPRWQAAALLEAGKVYERLDQWADAAETYQRLLNKFPTEPNAAEARQRLDRREPSGCRKHEREKRLRQAVATRKREIESLQDGSAICLVASSDGEFAPAGRRDLIDSPFSDSVLSIPNV